MKLKIAFATAILAISTQAFAGQMLTLPLQETTLNKDGSKYCFYSAELNLGSLAQAKPFQLFRKDKDGNYFEVKNGWALTVVNSELIVRVTGFSAEEKAKACAVSQEVLVLN